MKDILVSVIVPVYNVYNYLSKCVDSIVNQTYSNLEIILVDDGSTDGSSELCDEIAMKDSRIKVIHKENGGLSSARNAGIRVCKGDYIGFVDSDDWVEKDMYQCLLEANENNQTGICCAGRYDVYDIDTNKTIGLNPYKNEVITSEIALAKLLTWDTIDSSACDKLFLKELFSSVMFPEGRISEDVAIMYKLFDNAKRISLISKPLYNYFHHNNTITTKAFNSGKLHSLDNSVNILEFIKENYPSLIDKAQYFRMKTLENLLGSLIVSPEEDFSKYVTLCYELTNEYNIGRKKKIITRNNMRLRFKDYLFSNMKLVLLYRKCFLRNK